MRHRHVFRHEVSQPPMEWTTTVGVVWRHSGEVLASLGLGLAVSGVESRKPWILQRIVKWALEQDEHLEPAVQNLA